MKLLTHNMLQCHIKGVKNGYPFKIEAQKVETRDMDYDPDFLRHMFPRIQWDALREGAVSLGRCPCQLNVKTSCPHPQSHTYSFNDNIVQVFLHCQKKSQMTC